MIEDNFKGSKYIIQVTVEDLFNQAALRLNGIKRQFVFFFSINAYAMLKNKQIDSETANFLDGLAAERCNELGIEMGLYSYPGYKPYNTYPEPLLAELFDEYFQIDYQEEIKNVKLVEYIQ